MAKNKTQRTFAKSHTHASKTARELWQKGAIASLGTSRTYQNGLKLVSDWMRKNGGGALQDLSLKRARQYLLERAHEVSQSTLDRDRQAIQAVLQDTGRLRADQTIPVVKAERQTELKPRGYTTEQIQKISSHMAPHNSLAVEISYAAGLRAHELFTLAKRVEATPDPRPADDAKFRAGHIKYVVTGKGGLIREVAIPKSLAERLEMMRLDAPRTVRDRNVVYQQRYAIGGGQALSQAFSAASKAVLGYSTGLHGVRHGYAQQRHYETQKVFGDPERALRVVSQELGHFRPEITLVYLR